MERTEFSREATRLDREFQYLGDNKKKLICVHVQKQKQINKHLSLTKNTLYFTVCVCFPCFLFTECKIMHLEDIWLLWTFLM